MILTTCDAGERPFACVLCSYTSARKDNIKAHINRKHPDQYMAQATIVKKTVMPVISLSNEVYVCDKCGEKFVGLGVFTVHLSTSNCAQLTDKRSAEY